jgi:hypothetical protein
MIDNFNQISSLLTFESEDDFYHLQIIRRKKENPDLNKNAKLIKSFCIKDVNDLDYYRTEIINLCNLNNARACINLNKRSFEKIAFHTLKKVTDQIMNKDYKSVKKAYDSVCGTYSNDKDKKWIIDIDEPMDELAIHTIAYSLFDVCPIGNKIVSIIPTKSGCHIITKPFDVRELKNIFINIPDLHKDNPTILFIP